MAILKLDMRPGETLKLSGLGGASLTLMAKSGQRARFEVRADEGVRITPPSKSSIRSVVGRGVTLL